jgi:hypothetical protein
MSRSLLIVVLAVSALGCKSSDREAQPGSAASGTGSSTATSAAGKVLEVSGQVTANGKPIAVGAELAADDLIQTGADGRVVIELTHNLAHWQLGPNKSQKVSESIAWKLPRDEGNAKIVIQDMTAAGRPAERSAAETSNTAAPSTEPTAAPAPAPTPTPGAPPPAKNAPPAPPPPPPAPAKAEHHMGASKAAALPAPAPAPTLQPLPGGGGASRGPKGKAGPEEKEAGSLADIANDADAARAVATAQLSALAACVASETGSVAIDIRVAADGSAVTKVPDGLSAKAHACIDKVIAGLKFAKAATTVHLDVKH